MSFIAEMESNLDYAWHSDPLLEYSLYLSSILFVSILVFIGVIVKKHQRRQHEIRCQEKLKKLLDEALLMLEQKSSDLEVINQINESIKTNQINFMCAWSSIIESSDEVYKKQYLKIFFKLNHTEILSKAIKSKNIKQKCLSIHTVGSCKTNEFDETLISFSKEPVLSAYACIALAKTQQLSSISILIDAFKSKLISTTQLLSALVEIPRKQLLDWQSKKLDKHVNEIISRYLERT